MPTEPIQSPFASPNAIPPRTSSHGIVNGLKHRSSVLRPLSEIDWMSQSKKTKHSHSSTQPLRNSFSQIMNPPSQTHSYPTPQSPPPPGPSRGIGDELIYNNSRRWTEEKERILLGPYDYLYGHPGKDIRSQLIAAFNRWLKVPTERLEVITRVVGMLHTASLLCVDFFTRFTKSILTAM
jgi:geranylgeranyl diphosphate synthase, type III